MTRKLYVVKDLDADDLVGGVVWMVPSDAVAYRNFVDICMNPQTDMHKHPDSFALYRVGAIDADGLILPLDQSHNGFDRMVTAREVINAQTGGTNG